MNILCSAGCLPSQLFPSLVLLLILLTTLNLPNKSQLWLLGLQAAAQDDFLQRGLCVLQGAGMTQVRLVFIVHGQFPAGSFVSSLPKVFSQHRPLPGTWGSPYISNLRFALASKALPHNC